MFVELEYRELDDYKYQVKKAVLIQTLVKRAACKTEFIELREDGLLIVQPGYAWNGSNWSSDKHAILASLVHDVLYQLMRMYLLSRFLYREPADASYRDIYIAEGLTSIAAGKKRGVAKAIAERWVRIRAGVRYKGLQWFGEGATYPEKDPRGTVKVLRVKYK